MLLRGAIFAACCLLAAARGAGTAEAADLRVNFNELAKLVQAIVGDAKIRLHNVPAGFLDFTSGSSITMAGVAMPVPVPIRYFDRAGARYVYYMNEINSTGIQVVAVPGAVRISLAFEDEGPELVGACLSGLCPPEGTLPRIEWARPQVAIDLVPISLGNSISLMVKKVNVGGTPTPSCPKASFFPAGLCRVLLPFARTLVARQVNDLNEGLRAQFNTPELQQKLATSLKQYLVLGPAGEVRVTNIGVDPKGILVSFCLAC